MSGRIVLVSGSLLLAACGTAQERAARTPHRASPSVVADPDTPVSSDDPRAPVPPRGPTSECPVIASSRWNAAVIGKPPSAPDRLRVSGTLQLNTSGVAARLEQGAVLEIHPPIQQIELRFERSGGSDPEVEVRGEFPALNEYGAIEIRCGGRSLATITDVAWTE